MSATHDSAGREASERSDAQLLDALVHNLAPVRPIPRLRLRLLGSLGVGLAVFFAAVGADGLRADLGSVLTSRPEFLAALIGLAGLAFGSAVVALAASTPGREGAGRAGGLLAGVAFGAAVVACGAIAAWAGFARETQLSDDILCLRQSLILGALPTLAVLGVTLGGWVERPGLAAAAALASGGAFGALMVHLECGGQGPIHLLIGHLFVPLAAGLVLGLPLAVALRRWGR